MADARSGIEETVRREDPHIRRRSFGPIASTIAAGLFTFGFWMAKENAPTAYLVVQYQSAGDSFGHCEITKTVTLEEYQKMYDANYFNKFTPQSTERYYDLKVLGTTRFARKEVSKFNDCGQARPTDYQPQQSSW